MKELDIDQCEMVSGAADWGQVSAGLGAVAIAVTVAGGPLTPIVAGIATGFAYFGGVAIGDGLIDGGFFRGEGS